MQVRRGLGRIRNTRDLWTAGPVWARHRFVLTYGGSQTAPLNALVDRRVLGGLGDRDGTIGEDVQRERRVDRGRDVGADERHRVALGQRRRRLLVHVLARKLT